MSYYEALGAVIFGLFGLLIGGWYLWCVRTMLFRCARPRDFFCAYYSTSGLFLVIHVLGGIAGGAWLLTWATN